LLSPIPNIQKIYDDILRNPELLDTIVKNFCREHPDVTGEQIHIHILKIISEEHSREADRDKIRRQYDATRHLVLTKTLDNLPDSDSPVVKKAKIKNSSYIVSTSGTDLEREELADSLKDFTESQERRLRKREIAEGDIERRK